MKKLFFANLAPVNSRLDEYQLDCEHEVDVEDNWDGDMSSFLKKKFSFYPHSEDIKFYENLPYNFSLDRQGIVTNRELFVEFDDGDSWSMALYYIK